MYQTIFATSRIVLFGGVTALLLTACVNNSAPPTVVQPQQKEIKLPVTGINTTKNQGNKRDKTTSFERLLYHNKPVSLTRHAQCRMDCRHIDATEIQEMLDNGKINTRKSGQSKDESTCPTKALEGLTHDGQTVRIIVAECDTKVKIVTVIDLKNEFKCDCK